jgi:2,4-dienoyl-CoA reductase-like NADH-dependent reductase (Old Yellow Enzyme family)
MVDTLNIAEQVEAFLLEHSISPVTFGREAMKDPHFVRDLRNGRRLWPETETKVRRYMAEYVPAADRMQAQDQAA